jgi:1-deoxy-D-xylulose-5-phosphate reductoisomerase
MNRILDPLTAHHPAASPQSPRRVTILGATGSVGQSTISLVAGNPNYVVEALTAQTNADKLIEQAHLLRPNFVAIGDERLYDKVKSALAPLGIAVGAGPAAMVEAADRPSDWVMGAIVGIAGLAPILAAVRRGVIVAIANKEPLVSAGPLVLAEARRTGATLLPVDSEHNAIFQVFDFDRPESIEKIILTASGGPYRTADRSVMAAATPAEAVRHPNWSMGAKISIDSATLMNKGLELIEAARLFPLAEHQIEVLIHPQSVIHSMVAYVDGSFLAQLGTPDMRTPIAYSLAWPDRLLVDGNRLDLAKLGSLTFEQPDHERFPALNLARAALQRGSLCPCVLNAANEAAVEGFLEARIGFLDIVETVIQTVAAADNLIGDDTIPSLESIEFADLEARRIAKTIMARMTPPGQRA